MNDPIIQDLIRMRELFGIQEQSQTQTLDVILKSKDTPSLKTYLTSNPNLTKKLQELFSSPTLDDLSTKLLSPNNTVIMRGLQRSSMSRDMEMYNFLELLSKTKN
jgi:hypothetical protein